MSRPRLESRREVGVASRTVGMGLLERERRRRGLSATELAKQMGVSRSTISQVERGSQQASHSFQEKAASALAVDANDLWPEWWVLVPTERASEALELLHATTGSIIAFTTERGAARAAATLRNRGVTELMPREPIGPTALAVLFGISEDETHERLAIDLPANALNVEGAAPAKSRAVRRPSGGAARHASG